MKYNTRVAPSPTGDMHIGTLRTAYQSWLAARASGGRFLLRIDDTDDNRNRPELTDSIFEIMDWVGLDYDNAIMQSNRRHRYDEVAQTLIDDGFAIRLDDGAVTLKWVDGCPRHWHDEVTDKDILLTDDDILRIHGLVLMKSGDRGPTYNFASVVDDVDFDINYIIRGHDHISNTSKQVGLFFALGVSHPKFAHVGLIHMNSKKLSKRDSAASVLSYRDAGIDPDALLNFVLRMGWSPRDGQLNGLIDRDYAMTLFLNDGNLQARSSNFDEAKLKWFDKKYKALKRVGKSSNQ